MSRLGKDPFDGIGNPDLEAAPRRRAAPRAAPKRPERKAKINLEANREVWLAFKYVAGLHGTTATALIGGFMARYVEQHRQQIAARVLGDQEGDPGGTLRGQKREGMG